MKWWSPYNAWHIWAATHVLQSLGYSRRLMVFSGMA